MEREQFHFNGAKDWALRQLTSYPADIEERVHLAYVQISASDCKGIATMYVHFPYRFGRDVYDCL
jgi:hypothetical protein